MVPDRDCMGMLVENFGGEEDLLSLNVSEIGHAEEGTTPLPAKGLEACSVFSLWHGSLY